jgi:hypothetical protein
LKFIIRYFSILNTLFSILLPQRPAYAEASAGKHEEFAKGTKSFLNSINQKFEWLIAPLGGQGEALDSQG